MWPQKTDRGPIVLLAHMLLVWSPYLLLPEWVCVCVRDAKFVSHLWSDEPRLARICDMVNTIQRNLLELRPGQSHFRIVAKWKWFNGMVWAQWIERGMELGGWGEPGGVNQVSGTCLSFSHNITMFSPFFMTGEAPERSISHNRKTRFFSRSFNAQTSSCVTVLQCKYTHFVSIQRVTPSGYEFVLRCPVGTSFVCVLGCIFDVINRNNPFVRHSIQDRDIGALPVSFPWATGAHLTSRTLSSTGVLEPHQLM